MVIFHLTQIESLLWLNILVRFTSNALSQEYEIRLQNTVTVLRPISPFICTVNFVWNPFFSSNVLKNFSDGLESCRYVHDIEFRKQSKSSQNIFQNKLIYTYVYFTRYYGICYISFSDNYNHRVCLRIESDYSEGTNIVLHRALSDDTLFRRSKAETYCRKPHSCNWSKQINFPSRGWLLSRILKYW